MRHAVRMESVLWITAFLVGVPVAWQLGRDWREGIAIKPACTREVPLPAGTEPRKAAVPADAPRAGGHEGACSGLVLRVAYSFPNGGGFNWDAGTGTPEEIVFKGSRILSKARRGTYCCGFTFAVVMRAAAEAGLLQDKSVRRIRAFQQHWYAATVEAREKQQIYALEWLGIGYEVPFMEAQPGDFLRLWHGRSGHSVILVKWVVEGGRKVGVEYRGTQSTTDGIGSRVEYIRTAERPDGQIILARSYAGRLGIEQPR